MQQKSCKGCQCKGCETQRYYDKARTGQVYELVVRSVNNEVQDVIEKQIDLYDYYNIVSEYFGIEIDLEQHTEESIDGQ